MRCKNHYSTDASSTVGVCASCLRERLMCLIAAEEQVQAQAQNFDGKLHEKNPAFPSSVSPRVNSRKSDHHHGFSDQLFYKTPQVEPTTGGNLKKKRSFIRLLLFPNIFRSRNRKPVDAVSNSRESCDGNNATSTSWFSGIMSGGRQRRKPIDESTIRGEGGRVGRKQCRNRGMSPVEDVDVLGGDEGVCNATSGYESTESWRNTPRNRGVRRGHVRSGSSITFCLSPLVRASPNRKGLPPDVLLSNNKLFCANKSRKLADRGGPNPNR